MAILAIYGTQKKKCDFSFAAFSTAYSRQKRQHIPVLRVFIPKLMNTYYCRSFFIKECAWRMLCSAIFAKMPGYEVI
jgi:hypothetical protein